MIRYLSDNEKCISEALYREAFYEDKDEFVKYYYSYVTKNNKILVMEQAGEVCSMLHLNPYKMWVNQTVVDAYYYVAVATKEKCRHQGMMRKLLYRSLNDIHEMGHPFAYLMPANRAIYEPFDFRTVYQQKQIELPVEPQAANEKMAELFDVFTWRDGWYVKKMLEEQRVCADDEPTDFVPYIMTRITNVEKMLGLLQSENPVKIVMDVQDEIIPENHGRFLWEISHADSICKKLTDAEVSGENSTEKSLQDSGALQNISVSIAELTEFVFGRRKIEGLEAIKVLSRICINEIV